MEWLEEPLKVWHLAFVAVAFGVTFSNMKTQMSAIGRIVIKFETDLTRRLKTKDEFIRRERR